MSQTPTPTTLNVYYCENCHYIQANNYESESESFSDNVCPSCGEQSLVLLDKEAYGNNFNMELFPYPQNLILKNFFENANDNVQLFSVFGQEHPIKFLVDNLAGVEDIYQFSIKIQNDLQSLTELIFPDESITKIEGSLILLLKIFNQAS